MKTVNILILLLITNLLPAQTVAGDIAGISGDGWHKILVSPEIRSASMSDLADFRIIDDKGKEVPYFLVGQTMPTDTNSFHQYEILSKTAVPSKWTTVIVVNPKRKLDELALFISNSDVTKKYRISGSDDRQNWFGLIDSDSLSNLQDSEKTYVIKTIHLPASSYKFLNIELDDRKSLPLNIIKLGNFSIAPGSEAVFLQVQPTELNTRNIHQDKKTIISVSFKDPQFINRIQFDVDDPKLFRRTARIFTTEQVKVKRRTVKQENDLAIFTISSDNKNIVDLPDRKLTKFFIEIENGDNKPLRFADIRLLQRPVYAVADLKANTKYKISAGDSKKTAPDYDLAYFSNKITAGIPQASITNINAVSNETATKSDAPFWQQSWFLWVCISIGGLAILYFSISLVRDLNKK
ncbi:MAG TPA: hypothetical protein VF581_02780 [Flavobacterium sp.]